VFFLIFSISIFLQLRNCMNLKLLVLLQKELKCSPPESLK